MATEGSTSSDCPSLIGEEHSKKSVSDRNEEGKPLQSAEAAPRRKILVLHDWWLTIADSGSGGKRLGVGGYVKKGKQETRYFSFSSAYIVKRHDAATVETADGITLKLHGWLNKFRTLGKGFSEEVCDDFLIGFPDYWEEHAVFCVGNEPSASKAFSPSSAYEISAQQMSSENCFDLKAIKAAFSALNEPWVPKLSTDSGGPSASVSGNSERNERD